MFTAFLFEKNLTIKFLWFALYSVIVHNEEGGFREYLGEEQSVEFAKKQQSVTYLVFSTEAAELVGYFAVTIKPITKIQQLQNLAGGMVIFLEAANEEKLLSFYHENGFQQFDTRLTDSSKGEPHELIQLLKLL